MILLLMMIMIMTIMIMMMFVAHPREQFFVLLQRTYLYAGINEVGVDDDVGLC